MERTKFDHFNQVPPDASRRFFAPRKRKEYTDCGNLDIKEARTEFRGNNSNDTVR